MEGKKKKHKKKKGNQTNLGDSVSTAEDVNQTKPYDSVSNSEVLPDLDHGSAPEQNHHSEAPSNADSQSVGVSESDMEQERRKNLEAKCVEFQDEINKLKDEKNVWSQKEDSLVERLKILQNEVDFCIQREANFEEKIDDLQIRYASLTLKEATIEERVKKIEGNHESWTLEKSSIKDMLSKLGDANDGLSMQVMELKVSRDSLAQENKQLTESLSKLESRIQHLETAASFYAASKICGEDKTCLKTTDGSVEADLHNKETSEEICGEDKTCLKTTDGSVEADLHNKETAEEVSEIPLETVQHAVAGEKVSEISLETVQHAVAGEISPSEKFIKNSLPVKSAAPIIYSSKFQESMLESNENIRAMARAHVNGINDFSNIEQSQQIQLLGLDDSRISEDVVSVPLDDIIQEVHPPSGHIEPGPAVPLSDAPLIGAPFRLISFVARYVSGADLVDQDKPKASR